MTCNEHTVRNRGHILNSVLPRINSPSAILTTPLYLYVFLLSTLKNRIKMLFGIISRGCQSTGSANKQKAQPLTSSLSKWSFRPCSDSKHVSFHGTWKCSMTISVSISRPPFLNAIISTAPISLQTG